MSTAHHAPTVSSMIPRPNITPSLEVRRPNSISFLNYCCRAYQGTKVFIKMGFCASAWMVGRLAKHFKLSSGKMGSYCKLKPHTSLSSSPDCCTCKYEQKKRLYLSSGESGSLSRMSSQTSPPMGPGCCASMCRQRLPAWRPPMAVAYGNDRMVSIKRPPLHRNTPWSVSCDVKCKPLILQGQMYILFTQEPMRKAGSCMREACGTPVPAQGGHSRDIPGQSTTRKAGTNLIETRDCICREANSKSGHPMQEVGRAGPWHTILATLAAVGHLIAFSGHS